MIFDTLVLHSFLSYTHLNLHFYQLYYKKVILSFLTFGFTRLNYVDFF